MGHSTFAGKTENNFSRNRLIYRHVYWYRTEVKMRMQLSLPSIFIVVGCMIVISSVNGRNVDNAEGPYEREMIKKLEAERGDGPPSDPLFPVDLETTEGPATIDTTDGPGPMETTEGPVAIETTEEPATVDTTNGPAPTETTEEPAPSNETPED